MRFDVDYRVVLPGANMAILAGTCRVDGTDAQDAAVHAVDWVWDRAEYDLDQVDYLVRIDHCEELPADTCEVCGEVGRLHRCAPGAHGNEGDQPYTILVCDDCWSERTGLLAQCEDFCGLDVDHVGECRRTQAEQSVSQTTGSGCPGPGDDRPDRRNDVKEFSNWTFKDPYFISETGTGGQQFDYWGCTAVHRKTGQKVTGTSRHGPEAARYDCMRLVRAADAEVSPAPGPDGPLPQYVLATVDTRRSPFVRIDCGCIVLPLPWQGQAAQSRACLLLSPCDGKGPAWTFRPRDFKAAEVAAAVSLDDHNHDVLVNSLGMLIQLGHEAEELARFLKQLEDLRRRQHQLGNLYFHTPGKGEKT